MSDERPDLSRYIARVLALDPSAPAVEPLLQGPLRVGRGRAAETPALEPEGSETVANGVRPTGAAG